MARTAGGPAGVAVAGHGRDTDGRDREEGVPCRLLKVPVDDDGTRDGPHEVHHTREAPVGRPQVAGPRRGAEVADEGEGETGGVGPPAGPGPPARRQAGHQVQRPRVVLASVAPPDITRGRQRDHLVPVEETPPLPLQGLRLEVPVRVGPHRVPVARQDDQDTHGESPVLPDVEV